MAKPIHSVSADFEKVWDFFVRRGIVAPNDPKGKMDASKKMHRATYSLILWRFRLKGLSEHAKCFIEEIASDALQLLPQALMGYRKTVDLLTRGIAENALRHIYFMDHPIEFQRMNRDPKWHLTVEELLKYPLLHPAFVPIKCKINALSQIGTIYSELSAGVHGRTVNNLEMRASLASIGFEQGIFQKQVSLTEKCAASTNFLLAAVHRDQVIGFRLEDRRIILNSMPARERKIWSDLG